MVATQQSYMLGIFKFKTEQQRERLHGVEASVNKVTHKNVSSVRDLSSFIHQFKQVMKLPVNISTYRYRSSNVLNIALLH